MEASQILIVMVVAIGLTIFASRRGIQPPLLLAAVGLAASFIPGLPRTSIDPEILLAVVLPPLLYSAAVDFSFFSFIRRLGSILNLGVLLVIITAIAGGAVAGWMLPGLSLPAALVLGAVIAPPDAISAVAIGSQLRLPNRLMTILKGESLINDAAALTLFSAAVAAATGTRNAIENPWLYFLYSAFAGIVIGIVLGLLVHQIRRRLADSTLVTALAVLAPFAAYGLAEEIGASGVLAVVFAGFSLGHNAANLNFAGRIQEREVWLLVDKLLESFVFAYMGLQLRFVIEDARRGGFALADLGRAAIVLIVVVIGIRILWVFATSLLARLRYARWVAKGRPKRRRDVPEPLGWRENLVLSWSGMRGVVTLAAAAGTPFVAGDNSLFVAREAIIPLAFAVAIGTLLLQGLTLPLLVKVLGIADSEDPAYRRAQLQRARETIRKAAVGELQKLKTTDATAGELRIAEKLIARAVRTDAATDAAEEDSPSAAHFSRALELAQRVLGAQRQALIAERDAGTLDDEIMREVLEDIDLEEAVVASRSDRISS